MTSAIPSPVGILIKRSRGFGSLKLFGGANNPVQFLNRRVLVVNRKLRVANDVDEQDMGDFELDLLLDLGRHVPTRFIHILRCPVEQIKIDNRTSRGVVRYQPAPREGSSMSVILPKINQTGEPTFKATLPGRFIR